ncbi:MAG: hypothetical protein V2A55_00865 [Candidatus Jorgensenbacteria bacterium]
MKKTLLLVPLFALLSSGCATYTIRTSDVRETVRSGFRGFPIATLSVRNNSGRPVVIDAFLGGPVELELSPPTEVGPGEKFVVEVRRYLRSGLHYTVEVGAVAATAPNGRPVRAAVRSWSFHDMSRSVRNETWYVEEGGGGLRFR